MVEVYDSHEQSERVKGWLRENGSAIIMGLVLAFGGLFGFKQWQLWEDNKSQQASAEYETLIELLAEERLDAAVDNFEVLRTEYPDSAYSTLAALYMARARVNADQVDLAISLLEKALPAAEPAPLKVIIRERLARLYLDQGDTDAALAMINSAASATGFESRFEELRGDVYRVRGDDALALESYERALELSESGIGYRPLLEMKITELAGLEANAAGADS
jgi:predicted negative regulator of RcsB-dependent stress response